METPWVKPSSDRQSADILGHDSSGVASPGAAEQVQRRQGGDGGDGTLTSAEPMGETVWVKTDWEKNVRDNPNVSPDYQKWH